MKKISLLWKMLITFCLLSSLLISLFGCVSTQVERGNQEVELNRTAWMEG